MAVVEIPQGKLHGERCDDVFAFKGIPYAKPPVGKRRFAPPAPADSWPGVRDATRFSAVAPQLGTEAGVIGKLFRIVRGGVSEDCLYANVWTPGLDGGNRPVLAYIHGGAFLLGAGSTFVYEGSELARLGAVVVTFNYRLGAFGFLDLTGVVPGEAPAANLGIRDQVAALDWVRANVASFGGDPENVTLFGESAGAMSAAVHLGLSPRPGFRRVILQSGAAANVSSADEAAYISQRFLEELSTEPRDWRHLLELPMEALLAAQRRALAGARDRQGRLPWQPSVDGELIVEPPLEAVRRGTARDVELIIGTTRDEWKLFGLSELKLRRMGLERLRARVAASLARRGGDPGAVGDLVEMHRQRVGDRRRWPYETWVSIRTEQFFRLPAIQLAELQARHQPNTWVYRFDEPSSSMPRVLGACHGIDLGFVFGTFRHPLLRHVYGRSREVADLAGGVQARWVEFARSGRPALGGGPEWERYEASRRRTLLLARESSMAAGSDGRNRSFWPR